MADFVAAIDQGTTSTRCMVFDHDGAVVARAQAEHRQIMPRPGWVEHDPHEIWRRTREVVDVALRDAGLRARDLAALGITNQRETTVVWDRRTGEPYANAVVWQDTRTAPLVRGLERDGHGDLIRERSGLPPATYFSAGKLRWLLDHVDGLRAAAEAGDALFGTIDTWLLWHLTGGPDGGVHRTDVTNAGRTMLMDLGRLAWDFDLLDVFGVPPAMLPEIRPSSDPGLFETVRVGGGPGSALDGVPIGALLGDQHAAMIGQVALSPGDAKNTYGTGNFLLLNTGEEIVRSRHGLLSTVCYQLGNAPAVYALEGSIAVTGSAIQWLRDQLGLVSDATEVDRLAGTVADAGGIYFVPAFSGLFAPYWRPDARGVVVGLSRFHTAAHLARATLEAICYQSCDVADAMRQDAGIELSVLKVDGGVTASELCMQIQADLLGVEVVKPSVAETTALGAAYAAGLAVGFWSSPQELVGNWHEERRWSPRLDDEGRAAGRAGWRKAVDRTLDWVEEEDE